MWVVYLFPPEVTSTQDMSKPFLPFFHPEANGHKIRGHLFYFFAGKVYPFPFFCVGWFVLRSEHKLPISYRDHI